ncbi:Homeobox-leucine zipper protein HAT22 [Ananas comosus]|uniref:Homeobox-leucine zipper protein HAT22 n=1 Tax=Ananas comosus TaxID=4615 RepID=A0A199VPM2_ANACO|nr:Homeobox-leucine zipper protein HAT22 [Ananas comosus]
MDTACEANLVLGLSCASTVEFEPLPPNWSAAEPSLTLGLFESANPKMETEERKPELGDKESCRAISDEVEEEGIARKKLRLTKEQSSLLEDSFREHSTLNPRLKQALARKLNLRPRQVEVWFQNRRARCCETLSTENRKLQRELQELKSLKFMQPLYTATALTVCPSCKRMITSTLFVPFFVTFAPSKPGVI